MKFQAQMILYVKDPAQSAAFYAGLLESPAKQLSPNFAVITLDNGFMLSLLARDKAPAQASGGGESGELCLTVPDQAALEALHNLWSGKGVGILQKPILMYFGGHNFIAVDPDGHLIRVSTPDK